MPALKSDIYITITTAGKSFRIGGVRLPNNDKAQGAGGGFIACVRVERRVGGLGADE